ICLQLRDVKLVRSGAGRDDPCVWCAERRQQRNAGRVTSYRARSDRAGAKPARGTRDCFNRVDSRAEPVSFIAEEEEELVLDYWTTNRAAKLVEPQWSF